MKNKLNISKELEYTREDWLHYSYHFRTATNYAYFRCFFFGFLTPMILAGLLTKPDLSTLFYSLVFILMIFPGLILTPIVWIKSMIKKPEKKVYSFEFTESYLSFKKGGITTKIMWEEFTGRIIEDKYAFVFLRERSYTLPKRLFTDQEWQDLIRLITAKVNPKKLPTIGKKILWVLIGLALPFLLP